MRLAARKIYTKIQDNKDITVLVAGMEHLAMKQFVSQNRRRISARLLEVTAKETFTFLVTAMRMSHLPE